VNEIIVEKWAEFHADHPSVQSLKNRMTVLNPEWENAVRRGVSTHGIEKYMRLYQEIGRVVRFPRAVVNRLIGSSQFTIVDRTAPGEKYVIPSLIQLRDKQIPFVDDLEQALRTSYGAVGQAEAGFGKTIAALELVSRFGVKTLILVNKEFLMTQWIERILGTEAAAKKLGLDPSALSTRPQSPALLLRPDQVGIVQQDRCEWEGRPLVVAMAQSINAREYNPGFYESFGLILTDEVHRFAAPTFLQTIIRFPARLRLGVTATPERQDGLETIFFSHIGQIAAKGEGRKTKPKVHRVRTPVVVTPAAEKKMSRRGSPDFVRIVSYLTEHEARNRQIVKLALKAAEADRKVLILSARRKHLEDLRRMFVETCQEQQLGYSTTYYVGGMDLKARKVAERMQVLFATFSMAEEGLDIPDLDTLILATPVGKVHQAVGRIMRDVPEKKQPVVVDLVDASIGICAKLADRRLGEYQHEGYHLN
jgi:superfamily II DNA or RNA helicase